MHSGDLAHLRRARDLLDREYAKPLNIPQMARAALMSQSHFSRSFRQGFLLLSGIDRKNGAALSGGTRPKRYQAEAVSGLRSAPDPFRRR